MCTFKYNKFVQELIIVIFYLRFFFCISNHFSFVTVGKRAANIIIISTCVYKCYGIFWKKKKNRKENCNILRFHGSGGEVDSKRRTSHATSRIVIILCRTRSRSFAYVSFCRRLLGFPSYIRNARQNATTWAAWRFVDRTSPV